MIIHSYKTWLNLLTVSLFLVSCVTEGQEDNTQKEASPKEYSDISSIKESCCPDKRTTIFDIEVNGEDMEGETSSEEGFNQLSLLAEDRGLNNKITLLPQEDIEHEFGLISVSVAHLRGEAKHSSELVSQGLLGHPIRILKKEDNWYKVQLVDGYLGWMDKKSFIFTTADEKVSWENGAKSFILEKNVELTNTKGEVIYELVAGNIVLKDANNPEMVILPDGKKGFLQGISTLSKSQWTKIALSGEEIVSDAKQYLGIPYLWGGASSKGYDCSGLTKTVFLLNGIQLPRDASQQVFCGEEIAPGERFTNLQAGDLLFFGKKATKDKKEKVTHVAIYMNNGEMIHATGHVKIQSLLEDSPLFAEDRLKTFLRAKRISKDCIGDYSHRL